MVGVARWVRSWVPGEEASEQRGDQGGDLDRPLLFSPNCLLPDTSVSRAPPAQRQPDAPFPGALSPDQSQTAHSPLPAGSIR